MDLQIWRLTLEIVDAYPRLDSTQRERVRLLWRTYESFGRRRPPGIDLGALAREVADLSDDTSRDAMFGSTREMILRHAANQPT